MPLFEDCRELFGTDDLYSVLEINKDANEKAVKRAYHKLSLKVHPDRVDKKEKKEATRQFQTLGKIYTILSCSEKRKLYDETGEVDEENDISQDRDWYEYWRLLFKTVTVQDIKDFEKKYKDSEEEIQDLVTAYVESEGDMDQIMETVLCATHEDEERFRDILQKKIKKKEVPAFDSFTKESARKKKDRKKRAEKEAAEAEEMKTELGLGDDVDSLRKMIQQRQSNREKDMGDFFAQLEAKYAPTAKKAKGKGKAKK